MFVPIGSNSGESYQVQRSLRFRKAASAYASRTPGSAGNRKLTHFRDRIKRGELGTLQVIYSAGTSSIDRLYFDTSNRLCLDVLGTTRLVSTQVFRDPTAFTIDVGFQLDVANGTAAQRAKLMVDGVEVSAYSTDSRASITNTDTNWNNTVVHYLGRDNSGNYFDGYMAEPISVDGSLSSNYIATDTISGQLVASRPSATYGTNGFYLDFSDPTSLTTLMLDRSGNGNNWTASNISLTAGATYDSMIDVPLGAGGQERGNYATWNSLSKLNTVLSDGNLRSDNGYGGVEATIAIPIGTKIYGEFTAETTGVAGTNLAIFGVKLASAAFDASAYPVNVWAISWDSRLVFTLNGVQTIGASWFGSPGRVFQFAIDPVAGSLWLGTDDVWYSAVGTTTSAPDAGGTPAVTGLPSGLIPYFSAVAAAGAVNFGQRPFAYTPPTGFKALHTGNLTNVTPIASGSFAGNLSADGPFIWCNGTPDTLTINGNAVTWGTHADKLANGFKVRTSSSSYNSSGTNNWTATYLSPSSKSAFKYQNAKGNP